MKVSTILKTIVTLFIIIWGALFIGLYTQPGVTHYDGLTIFTYSLLLAIGLVMAYYVAKEIM